MLVGVIINHPYGKPEVPPRKQGVNQGQGRSGTCCICPSQLTLPNILPLLCHLAERAFFLKNLKINSEKKIAVRKNKFKSQIHLSTSKLFHFQRLHLPVCRDAGRIKNSGRKKKKNKYFLKGKKKNEETQRVTELSVDRPVKAVAFMGELERPARFFKLVIIFFFNINLAASDSPLS